MKQEKLSVLFFILKNRVLKSGEAPIIMRVTIGGNSDEARIQQSVPVHLWDHPRSCCKGKGRISEELNEYIRSLIVKLFTIDKELLMEEAYITPQLLLKRVFGQEEKRMVLKSFLGHNEECRKLIGINYETVTINHYDNCGGSFAAHVKAEREKDDITFAELNGELIRSFEIFLKTERGLCQNTVIRYMKCFKKFINLALANEWMKKNPFFGIKYKQVETNPVFLTKEELDLIINKEFSIERLELVKDLFLFSAFTGLAFIDAKELCSEDIYTDNDGNLWIRKSRHKIKDKKAACTSNVPLLEIPRQILEKYKTHPLCVKKGVCLPLLSNQKMNSYLGEIADFCGIKKKVTTHV